MWLHGKKEKKDMDYTTGLQLWKGLKSERPNIFTSERFCMEQCFRKIVSRPGSPARLTKGLSVLVSLQIERPFLRETLPDSTATPL